jgi:hypothetical protein
VSERELVWLLEVSFTFQSFQYLLYSGADDPYRVVVPSTGSGLSLKPCFY